MSLDLPRSPYTAIFREVVDILKTSSTLSVVKSWKGFEGKPDDFVAPPVSMFPSIAFQVSSIGMAPWSQGAHEETMIIDLEIAVNGTDNDDLLNLWYAVIKALAPHGMGRKRIVAKATDADKCTIVGGVDLGNSALKHTKLREEKAMVGVGSIAINMIIKE